MQVTIDKNSQSDGFNTQVSAPRYAYERSPVHPRAFIFLKHDPLHSAKPQQVGDYTVLDVSEDIDFSERKVMNLVSLLNGRKDLMQLGHETGLRVLYRVLSRKDEDGMMKILFYNLGHEGVSVENALLRLECSDEI